MTSIMNGKFLGILNSRELIINLGTRDGVKIGMIFKILGKPIEIRDPENNELLGMHCMTKVVVKVKEAEEKYSICETFRTVPQGIVEKIGSNEFIYSENDLLLQVGDTVVSSKEQS